MFYPSPVAVVVLNRGCQAQANRDHVGSFLATASRGPGRSYHFPVAGGELGRETGLSMHRRGW